MDWAKILKVLKANGFTGDGTDLAAVKAFAADFTLMGEDGTAIDLDAAHKAHATKARKPLVVPSEDVDALKAENKRLLDAARKANSAAAMTAGSTTDTDGAMPSFFIANAAKKAFQAECNAGRTYFKDADTAEVCGAWLKASTLHKLGETANKAYLDAIDICKKANVSYDFSSGGFAIPEVLSSQIIDVRSSYEALTKLVNIIPISAQGETVPRIAGGITVYSPGEGVAATESNIAGDQVRLQPFEMVALSTVTTKQLQASNFAFGDKVAERMRYAIMQKLEQIYVLGDGTSTYFNQRGLNGKLQSLVTGAGGTWSTNAEYAAAIVRGSGNLWSELTYQDIQNLRGSIGFLEGTGPLQGLCSWQFYNSVLVPAAMSKGGVPALEVVNGIPQSWMGMPLVISNAMPQVEANGSVCMYFGDFNHGTKVGVAPETLSMSVSTERYWDQRKVGYQMALNYAINCHDLGNASSTAASREDGPIAALITAES